MKRGIQTIKETIKSSTLPLTRVSQLSETQP